MPHSKKDMRRYSEEEKVAALELGASVGRRAATRLLGISASTFQAWTESHHELWRGLRESDPNVRRTRVAENLEDLADQYTAVEFEALERAEKLVKTADPKETAALIKAMGSARTGATAGARGYRGEDIQHIEQTVNFPALEAAANAILERAAQRPILVENVAETDDERD